MKNTTAKIPLFQWACFVEGHSDKLFFKLLGLVLLVMPDFSIDFGNKSLGLI
jgi:hypothetical protein